MRLNEKKLDKYGLPDGFMGVKCKVDEVRGKFEILRVCLLRSDSRDDDGNVMISPRTNTPYSDWMVCLNIRTEDGRQQLVWTTSGPIVRLFRADIGSADNRKAPDFINKYGKDVWILEAPEGWVRFTTVKEPYNNGKLYDVPDLEEAE